METKRTPLCIRSLCVTQTRQEEAAYGYLGNGEHDVSGCHQGVGISHQLVANHLRKHHADGLAQHDGFGFDSAYSCKEGMTEDRSHCASLYPASIIQSPYRASQVQSWVL